MKSNNKVIAMAVAVLMMVVCMGFPASAQTETGAASIGFSAGQIRYVPMGISGIEPGLGFSFGSYAIDNSTPVQTYGARNKAGYVVENGSGGQSGYRVTLNLSPFDRGLEGAVLKVSADSQGLISNMPGAADAPYLLGGYGFVELEADGDSAVEILRGTRYEEDPAHTAKGRWGANFVGDLTVYANTVLAGDSRAVMTWELTIA